MTQSLSFSAWLQAFGADSHLGILCPLPEEMEQYTLEFARQNSVPEPLALPGIEAWRGVLWGIPVVVARCGVGKVHAAYAGQMLVREAHCRALILSGVAGALHPDLDVGDLLVSSSALQHDMDVTPLGFAPAQIPWTQWTVFEANADLVRFAQDAAVQAGLGLAVGRVVSGDQFVADPERVRFLRETLGGDCVEMEAGALAQACRLLGLVNLPGESGTQLVQPQATTDLPWITVRGMSDRADHSAPVDFPALCQEVATKSFTLVRAMLAPRSAV
jgi:adenosylhomocysteine nucleosidase